MRYSGNSKGSFGNRSHRSVRSFQASGIQRKLVGAQLDAPVPKRLDRWLIDNPPVLSAKLPVISGSTATYNKATNWLSVTFDSVPTVVTRNELKRNGFRYEPYSKRWRASYTTDREDLLKHYAGSIEEINIAPNWEAKAEHAANQAAKHKATSNQLFEREHKLGEVIPFGQPIIVGHYSEKADRNFRNRLENMSRKACEEHKVSEAYQEKAERYAEKAKGESAGLIYRRIQKLEADKRKMERELAAGQTREGTLYYSGNISEGRKQEIKRWIDHYDSRLKIEHEKYKASGGIATDTQQFKPGDIVFTRHGLGKIASISKKTARIRLDSDIGIYTNQKHESLMPVDSIKQKLTEEQIQKYKNALKEANKTSYIF